MLRETKKNFCLIYYLSKVSCSPSYFTGTFFFGNGVVSCNITFNVYIVSYNICSNLQLKAQEQREKVASREKIR